MSTSDGVVFCVYCSTENTADSFFCKKCGAQLEGVSIPEDFTMTVSAPVGPVGPETVIAERYRVMEVLGEGGMGVVYGAEDLDSGQAVAIKFLRPSSVGATGLQRFQREMEIAKRLEHPHLVRLLDTGRWEDASFIVMELVDGESFKRRIQRGDFRRPDTLLPMLRQLCDGLGAVHDAGVVHGDVKPSNVLLTQDGAVKVCDFGLAFTEGMSLTRITKTGTMMGTPEYMAPEQIEGRRVDTRADIYSLGVLMYEAVSGELPFTGENSTAVMMQHMNKAPLRHQHGMRTSRFG